MVKTPETNNESQNPNKKKGGSPAVTTGLGGSSPASDTKENTDSATDEAQYGERIMRPFIALWRLAKKWFSLADKHDGGIVASATLMIVILTFVYAWYSRRQWQVMRDTLTSEHRPWVGISGNNSFTLQLSENGPLKVAVNAQNFGSAPALNQISVNKMETVGQDGHVPNFGAYSKSEAGPPVVLFPGSATTIRYDTTKPSDQGNSFAHLSTDQVAMFKTGTVRIYIFGSIWYDDTFHGRHKTDYCFTYDPGTSTESMASFVACQTHNSAD